MRAIAILLMIGAAHAETKSEWFKSLMIPGTTSSCCDIADCHPTLSKFQNGQWFAESRVDGQMTPIPKGTELDKPSYDGQAYLCESLTKHVYCFVKPGGDT